MSILSVSVKPIQADWYVELTDPGESIRLSYPIELIILTRSGTATSGKGPRNATDGALNSNSRRSQVANLIDPFPVGVRLLSEVWLWRHEVC